MPTFDEHHDEHGDLATDHWSMPTYDEHHDDLATDHWSMPTSDEHHDEHHDEHGDLATDHWSMPTYDEHHGDLATDHWSMPTSDEHHDDHGDLATDHWSMPTSDEHDVHGVGVADVHISMEPHPSIVTGLEDHMLTIPAVPMSEQAIKDSDKAGVEAAEAAIKTGDLTAKQVLPFIVLDFCQLAGVHTAKTYIGQT